MSTETGASRSLVATTIAVSRQNDAASALLMGLIFLIFASWFRRYTVKQARRGQKEHPEEETHENAEDETNDLAVEKKPEHPRHNKEGHLKSVSNPSSVRKRCKACSHVARRHRHDSKRGRRPERGQQRSGSEKKQTPFKASMHPTLRELQEEAEKQERRAMAKGKDWGTRPAGHGGCLLYDCDGC